MSTTTTGSAIWANPSSLTVELDISRFDTATNGTSLSFYSNGLFNYTFTVSADTTVTVDYDVIATSTSTSTSGTVRWWGMGDYFIKIDNTDFHTIDTGFTPASSPNILQDTAVFNILAGTHTLSIQHSHNGTGNFPGDRTADGEFNVTIGPVPEPSSLALLALGLFCMVCRRRKRV